MNLAKKSGFFGEKRNYRIIGILVIIIGIILLMVGYFMVELGGEAKSRYETIGGGILRVFSSNDQENYEDAKDSIFFGHLLEVMGALIIVIGVIILIKPELPNYIDKVKSLTQINK